MKALFIGFVERLFIFTFWELKLNWWNESLLEELLKIILLLPIFEFIELLAKLLFIVVSVAEPYKLLLLLIFLILLFPKFCKLLLLLLL